MPDLTYVTKTGRDLRLDLLRGYFVVAMIVDHVRGASPIYLLTGGNRFYTSAAEGFILTSGLVTGLVYQRLIARDDLGSALHKLLQRALALYLLTVGLTLLFLPISEILYLPWAQGVDLSNPLALVVSILTLHRTYYLVDVMLLYTVVFIFVPVGSPVWHEVRLWLQDNMFAKVALRPGRILASAITFSFLFLFVTFFWNRVQRLVGWLLVPLGQSRQRRPALGRVSGTGRRRPD